MNVMILLISGIIMLYALRGSIQQRLALFKDFSFDTLKFIVKTAVFLFAGFFISFLIFKFATDFQSSVSEQTVQKSDLKDESVKSKNSKSKKSVMLILSWIFYFISLSLLVLKRWAVVRFPIDEIEVVYFTLKNIRGGVDKTIFLESGKIVFLCLILSLIFLFSAFFAQKKNGFEHFYFKFHFLKKIRLNVLFFILGVLYFLLSLFSLYKDLNVRDFINVAKVYSVPAVDSEFYISEYVAPAEDSVIFPEKKKNLIVIFMESMESSFSDTKNFGLMEKNLIPNLTKLAEENINFSNTDKIGGGTDLSGTGWTVAAMLSKFSGLPYNLRGAANPDIKKFLPGAVTLTDILSWNGYTQRFVFGSDKHFASRDILLETHGNVEIHDIYWYKKNNLLPQDYSVFWGFEDKKLYEFAKTELSSLADENAPFFLGLLTTDTHMPQGFLCEDCPTSEDMQLKNAILCADRQVSDFIDWCKAQIWYEDTVIVIMGDHLFMASEDTNPFGGEKYLTAHRLKSDLEGMDDNPRRWIDVFINASVSFDENVLKNRKFSSFDMFPTIFAALGCDIKENKLGFGMNLFSGEKTLCERFSEDFINSKIMERNIQYETMEQVE